MGFDSRKGRQEGLLLASAVFPRLSALPRMRKGYCPSTCSPRQDLPHRATAQLQFKEEGGQGAAFQGRWRLPQEEDADEGRKGSFDSRHVCGIEYD